MRLLLQGRLTLLDLVLRQVLRTQHVDLEDLVLLQAIVLLLFAARALRTLQPTSPDLRTDLPVLGFVIYLETILALVNIAKDLNIYFS